MTDPPGTAVEQRVFTQSGWAGCPAVTLGLPTAACPLQCQPHTHSGKARLAPRQPQGRLQSNRICSVTDTAWGPWHTRKGGDEMLPLRGPHRTGEDEVRFEGVGFVLVLVTQDFAYSPGSSAICLPLALAASVQGSQVDTTEPCTVGWFQWVFGHCLIKFPFIFSV